MNINVVALILLSLAFFALTFQQGFWTCCLMMFNITFAGIMAFNYSAPMANLLIGLYDGLYYFAEFLSIWILFLIFFAISRAITDKLSPVPVRIGGGGRETVLNYLFCVWATNVFLAWCCFTLFSAPIAADGFQTLVSSNAAARGSGMFFGSWYVGAPSYLGMGLLGKGFDVTTYADSRIERNAELKTKDGLFVAP